MSQAQSFDASIPVLTEVLKAEPLRDDVLPGEFAPSAVRATPALFSIASTSAMP